MASIIPVARLRTFNGKSSPSNVNGTIIVPDVKNLKTANKINGNVADSVSTLMCLCSYDFEFGGK